MSESVSKLVVVHNIREQGILHVNELGGLPCPSLAIVRNDIPFNDYGEISLIAAPSFIDPKKVNVFDSDIYSPRQPRCQYEILEDNFNHAMEKIYAVLPEYPRNLRRENMIIERLRKGGTEELFFGAMTTNSLMLAFARSRNQNYQLTMKDAPVDEALSRNPLIHNWMISDDHMHLNYDDAKLEELGALMMDVGMRTRPGTATDDPVLNEKIANRLQATYQKIMERKLKKTETGLKPIVSIWNFMCMDAALISGPKNKIIDEEKLTADLMPYISANEKSFSKWIDDAFKSSLGRRNFFTYNKNAEKKRIEYNLQNVVTLMNKGVRDGEGFKYGPGSLRALLAKQFKSLDEIEAKINNIVPANMFAPIKEDTITRFNDLCEKLKLNYRFDPDNYTYRESVLDALKAYGAKGIKEFHEYMTPLSPDLMKEVDAYIDFIRHAPTTYFEGKIRRAVQLNEFAGAIVPTSISDDVLNILKEQGLKVVCYADNDHADRLRAVNQFQEFMFGKGDVITFPFAMQQEQDNAGAKLKIRLKSM